MTAITAMGSSMRAFQCWKLLASGQVDRTLNTRSRLYLKTDSYLRRVISRASPRSLLIEFFLIMSI